MLGKIICLIIKATHLFLSVLTSLNAEGKCSLCFHGSRVKIQKSTLEKFHSIWVLFYNIFVTYQLDLSCVQHALYNFHVQQGHQWHNLGERKALGKSAEQKGKRFKCHKLAEVTTFWDAFGRVAIHLHASVLGNKSLNFLCFWQWCWCSTQLHLCPQMWEHCPQVRQGAPASPHAQRVDSYQ